MSIIVKTQGEWNISQRQQDIFDQQEIESILIAFNQAGNGTFYMLDYFRKKVFVASKSSWILCGYPKEFLDKKGFDFFKLILDPKEKNWLDQVNSASWDFFHRLPEEMRKHLKLTYDLTVKTVNGEAYVLHHTIVPFKLCKNGNLWMGLCHIVVSTSKEMSHNAQLIDAKTGQVHNFSNGEFMLSAQEVLTYVEKQILLFMAKNMTGKQISDALAISMSVYNRHKRSLFNKLGVDKAVSAVHKAHLAGII